MQVVTIFYELDLSPKVLVAGLPDEPSAYQQVSTSVPRLVVPRASFPINLPLQALAARLRAEFEAPACPSVRTSCGVARNGLGTCVF